MIFVSKPWSAGWVLGIGLLATAAAAQEPAPPGGPPASTPPAQAAGGPDPEAQAAIESLRKGDLDATLGHLEKLVTRRPELPPARGILAELLFQASQPGLARAQLERALRDDPRHPALFVLLGRIALAEQRYAEALLDFTEALELPPPNEWTATRTVQHQRDCLDGQAAVAEARTDWDAALATLRKRLELEPSNALARQRLARALYSLNQSDQALQELQKAAADDPSAQPPELSMAVFAAQKPDPKRTREWLDRALEKAPNDFRTRLARARWFLDQGDPPAATAEADAALGIDPQSREIQPLRGLIALAAGEPAKAEELFQAIARESPGDFANSDRLAWACADQDEPAKRRRGLELAEVNARQYPRSPQAMTTLAWALYRGDRLDEAEQAIQKAIQMGASDSETAFTLAHVHAARKRDQAARQLMEQAASAPGSFIHRKQARAWLESHPATPAAAPAP